MVVTKASFDRRRINPLQRAANERRGEAGERDADVAMMITSGLQRRKNLAAATQLELMPEVQPMR